ncbi:MAG: hypothetical protein AAGA85_26985, partial [Bacteroidota bacterium]
MRKLLFIGLLLTVGQGWSQSKLPSSADHTFVPQDAIKNPQPVSFFSMLVGLDQSDDINFLSADLPVVGPLRLSGEVLFADIGVKASIKLKDWVAFRLNYNVAVRVGTDVQSLLVQGINSITTYESLWQIRFLHLPRVSLAGTFGFNRIDADIVDVAGYVASIVDGVPDPSVNRKIRSLTGEVGLLGSYAINSVMGVLIETDMEIGDHVGVETPRLFWSAKASIDANFNERYNFPLGAAVTVGSTTLPEFVVPARRQAIVSSVRLAYMGSPVFNLGITITNSRFPLER